MRKSNNAIIGAAVGITVGTAAYMLTSNLNGHKGNSMRRKTGKAINTLSCAVNDICGIFR